jgi:hypothetical protein
MMGCGMSVKTLKKVTFSGNAKEFLKNIGVREFDEKAAIELRLKFYDEYQPDTINKEYYEDIKQFVKYWKKNIFMDYFTPSEVRQIFKPYRFLFVKEDNKSIAWKHADEIYIDKPFMATGLTELEYIHNKNLINSGFLKNLNKKELADFIEFIKSLGAMYKLDVVRLSDDMAKENPNNPYSPHSDYNWVNTATIEDYDIQDNIIIFMWCLKSISASKLVWDTLISANKVVGTATYRPNKKCSWKQVESTLIYYLKVINWVPDKLGNFFSPRDITYENLHESFEYDDSNGLLTAIEFGHNEKNRLEQQRKLREQESEEYKQIDSLAKNIGLDSGDEMRESAELYKKMKSQGKVDEFKKLLDSEQPDFSEDSSSNPSRRFEKLKEDAINSPKKLKEMRQRSVSDGEYEKVKQKAKEYLKDRYTINDVLYCQICKKEMPFKLSDGSYYFEVVSLINDTEKSYKYNFIALCPVDAAKFKFANTSRNNMKTLIKEIIENRTPEEINNNENGKNYIELVLADNSEVIEFTPKHLGDIKSTLDD